MPAGAIHFVTETGQSEIGVPGKKRLSKINSHVARFSHNRRKNNKNNTSTNVSRTASPLQVDFVIESPPTSDSRSSSDSPKSIVSIPTQSLEHDAKAPNAFQVELPERRHSTGQPESKVPFDNKLSRHNSVPVDPTTFPDEDESKSLALVRTRSEEPHSTGQVPRIGSMGSTLPLGTSVDLYEKYLLSYYFTELPTKMFGFHKDALYCPYRTDAARTMQKSPSALHWILVIAEQQMNKYAPEQSRAVGLDQSILKRRANGYGVLRNLFNNPNFDLEDAIITLRYAISAECYVAHADASIEHLKALDSLLQRPGMIKFFAANMDRTALSLANLKRGYVNAPIPIKSANDFDNIKTMIFHNLRRLQILSKQNHVELIRHATTTYLRQNDGNGPGQPTPDMFQSNGDPQVSLLGRYISVKKSTLFSAYTSETMNATCNPNIKYSLQAGLLELFYGLNMTLASFGGQNLADRIMFLQRLKSVLDTSSERSLTASAITALVDRVREQYYSECFSREERTTKEVDMCTFGINILKIFALMDGESRTQLTTAVRAWLLSDISMDSSMQEEDLTEEDLVSMEDQVTRSWWKEHLTSKAAHSASLSPAP